MEFQVSAQLCYQVTAPGTLVLNIRALQPQHESLIVKPAANYLGYDAPNNRLVMLPVERAGELTISYQATVHNNPVYIDFSALPPLQLAQMVPAVLAYLNPSRYCQSDKLIRLATHLFGMINNEFEKVLAITEWIHKNVEYVCGSTNNETTACDTITQRAGVCRDFAHLGIALCRALDIPARYCSVYAWKLNPPDFHACFEAYLSGHWVLFDATKLAPLNGFVKIANGLDAADTAFACLFGEINGVSVQVNSQSASVVDPFYYSPGSMVGISYE